MKKIFFLFALFVCFHAKSQVFFRKSEFGLGVGGSNYFGDLNPEVKFRSAGYSGSIFYKYNITKYIALKLNSSFAHIAGDDKNSTNPYQLERNLNFQNNIFELAFGTEFHFFEYKIGDFEHRFTPYLTLGIARFWYDPYTTLEGKNYFLRPLGTEGQNYESYKSRRYTNRSTSYPIGLGFKYWLAKGITLSIEITNRLTKTDYIDDVSTTYVGIDKFQDNQPTPYPIPAAILQDRSLNNLGSVGKQRGISTTTDQYMTMQFGFSFRLPTYRCPDDF